MLPFLSISACISFLFFFVLTPAKPSEKLSTDSKKALICHLPDVFLKPNFPVLLFSEGTSPSEKSSITTKSPLSFMTVSPSQSMLHFGKASFLHTRKALRKIADLGINRFDDSIPVRVDKSPFAIRFILQSPPWKRPASSYIVSTTNRPVSSKTVSVIVDHQRSAFMKPPASPIASDKNHHCRKWKFEAMEGWMFDSKAARMDGWTPGQIRWLARLGAQSFLGLGSNFGQLCHPGASIIAWIPGLRTLHPE